MLMTKRKVAAISLSLIFLLSGCILEPKQPLEKEITREADSEELNAIITLIESYDMLDFVKIDPDNSLVFQGFSKQSGVFVRNITQFFTEAEKDYDNHDYSSGKLNYFITGKLISSENISSILTIIDGMIGNKTIYFDPLDDKTFINYYPLNSSSNTTVYQTDYGDFNSIAKNMYLTNSMWLILVDMEYFWNGRFDSCQGFEFEELILIDKISQSLLVLAATSAFAIC